MPENTVGGRRYKSQASSVVASPLQFDQKSTLSSRRSFFQATSLGYSEIHIFKASSLSIPLLTCYLLVILTLALILRSMLIAP